MIARQPDLTHPRQGSSGSETSQIPWTASFILVMAQRSPRNSAITLGRDVPRWCPQELPEWGDSPATTNKPFRPRKRWSSETSSEEEPADQDCGPRTPRSAGRHGSIMFIRSGSALVWKPSKMD